MSDVEDSSKPVKLFLLKHSLNVQLIYLQHLEPGTEPFSPEQEFGEMTLSDYDSDEDADYKPSSSEDSEDELEYNSDASDQSDVSEDESEEISGDVEI